MSQGEPNHASRLLASIFKNLSLARSPRPPQPHPPSLTSHPTKQNHKTQTWQTDHQDRAHRHETAHHEEEADLPDAATTETTLATGLEATAAEASDGKTNAETPMKIEMEETKD
jgi:hypothetical protein